MSQHGAMSDGARPYATAAAHYLRGRPPYSAQLPDLLEDELGLDGPGTLIDVGCGPGVLAVQLAPLFETVIGIDPEPEMLVQARRNAADNEVRATWIEARAEDLAMLDLPAGRLVTSGSRSSGPTASRCSPSFTTCSKYGGAVALIAPAPEHGSPPVDPPAPPIPHDEIESLLGRYLGWSRSPRVDTYETSLEQSPFGTSRSAPRSRRHRAHDRRGGLGLPVHVVRRARSLRRSLELVRGRPRGHADRCVARGTVPRLARRHRRHLGNQDHLNETPPTSAATTQQPAF